jgi:hypothetical protein
VTLSGPEQQPCFPVSVLKKRPNSICYHAARKSADMGESIIGRVPSVDNPADIFSKVVPVGIERNHLIHLLLMSFIWEDRR